jgi:hypothetical protein
LDEPTSLSEGTVVELVEVDEYGSEMMEAESFSMLHRSVLEPNPSPSVIVSHFDVWVSEHNPDPELEYGKGFWDYVEMLRRLIDKFDAEHARVVGTYVVHTPPPEEELPMPAVAFDVRGVRFALKFDFGATADWPYEWIATVVRRSPYVGPVFGLFEQDHDLSSHASLTGLPRELILGSFRKNPSAFTCRLVDEWDVATLVRLLSHEA